MRGIQKPRLGALLNPEHLFAQNLSCYLLFNEQCSYPFIYKGPAGRIGSAILPLQTSYSSGTNTPIWTSNTQGPALDMTDLAIYFDVAGGSDWVKPSPRGVTLAVVRRKIDTTNRATQLFGNNDAGTARFIAYAPYNDNNVYWDYGGNGGANRLTITGLSFSTQPEKLIFTAGPNGLAVWQNGLKVGSQSNDPGTLTASTNSYVINRPDFGTQRDAVEFGYFAVYQTQWPDEICRYWSTEPYAHLYTEIRRTYFFLGSVSSGIIGTATIEGPSSAFSLVGSESIIGTASIIGPASLLAAVGSYTPNAYAIVSPNGAINPYVRCFRF